MSVVIIGGNDCMVCKYKEICKSYNCKPKVFTHMKGSFKDKIGNPDLMVLFTSTASHKMVKCALTEAKKQKSTIERCHTSSATALKNILEKHTA